MREEHIDEAVMVQARFLPGGGARPTAFSWRGHTHYVVGLGRQWTEDTPEGACRCFMAETASGDLVELRWYQKKEQWRLARAWWREWLA